MAKRAAFFWPHGTVKSAIKQRGWSRKVVGWPMPPRMTAELADDALKMAIVRTFSGREEAALEIFEYIKCFYSWVRIHSALGWLSPEEFEKKQMEESRSKAA